MNNIIFLDIDGPLMPTRQWLHPENSLLRREFVQDPSTKDAARWWKTINERPDFCERIKFDSVAVEMFNQWARLGNAQVVVASNWANWLSKKQLKTIFKCNNLTFKLHRDWRTPKKFTSNRVHEIGMWMTEYPRANALVVDDDLDVVQFKKYAEQFPDNRCEWEKRATFVCPSLSSGLNMDAFNNGLKALGVDPEDMLEEVFAIKKLTAAEKEQYQKDLDLLVQCIC